MNNLANYVYNLVISNYYVDDIQITYFSEKTFYVHWWDNNHSYTVRINRGNTYYVVYFKLPTWNGFKRVSQNLITIALSDILSKYSQFKPRLLY